MNSSNKELALQSAQLAHLLKANLGALISSAVLASILAYMMSDVVERIIIILWLAIVLLVTVTRFVLFNRYKRIPANDYATIQARLKKFRFSVLIGGLLWGLASLLMFPESNGEHRMFLILVLIGISSGVVITYAADRISAFLFSTLVMLPLVILLFAAGDVFSSAMGVVGILYLAYLYSNISQSNKSLFENFNLQFEVAEREKIIMASAGLHQSILNRAMNGFWLTDSQTRLLQVNEAYCRMSGYSEQELLEKHVYDLDALETSDEVFARMQNIIHAGEGRFETEHRRKDGSTFHVEVSVQYRDAEDRKFVVFLQDITERKITQQELSERDHYWKFAIEGFGDCLWDTNEVEKTITYSKAWLDLTGYAEGELSNSLNEWESRIHPDDKVATLAAAQRCFEGKTPTYISEYRTLCKDGSYKWILDRGIVLGRGNDGKPLRMVGTFSDITDRKLSELELQIAATAFESQESIMITDANKKMVRVNNAFIN
ncbi:MAG: PAS domain S-box protein, partial [Methylotenera sp.]|nr:PAS domain S-box protein [Methylotenera sp.]